MRKTQALLRVALVLMADQGDQHWGYETGRRARVRSGVLYPILRRMLEEGWLIDGWEDPAEAYGRPPRRYYELTDTGRRELGGIIESARSEGRFGAVFGLGTENG
jgi:PadR family transcriptional regulator PadR